ncbi:hypothetical protein ACF0H5_000987 [Mactra antiquata]
MDMNTVGAYPPQYQQPGGPAVYNPGLQPIPGQYPNNVVVVNQTPHGLPRMPGMCQVCGVGVIRDRASFIGLILAIVFFPIGIICCLMTVEKRCVHCHAKA